MLVKTVRVLTWVLAVLLAVAVVYTYYAERNMKPVIHWSVAENKCVAAFTDQTEKQEVPCDWFHTPQVVTKMVP